jgi:hypothetical protein
MIVCVNVSRNTKELMDSFVERGDYNGYAELIESAVTNMSVLRTHMAEDKAILIDSSERTELPKPNAIAGSSAPATITVSIDSVLTPEIFRLHQDTGSPVFAEITIPDLPQRGYLPQDWFFGQHNKLLPVKATCRAIRAMLATSPDGVDLGTATNQITNAAVILRQMLVTMDSARGSGKGDSLAAGFPTKEEKARLRFASQFVGTASRVGSLSGLPADLKLIGVVGHGRKVSISLTQAGWDFTEIENPILDHNQATCRLTDEESAFLLRHIDAYVPSERSAFRMILHAITVGSDTPDALDRALREFVGNATEIKDSHLATQRAGAVARMFDLGLIGRAKTGLFVRYYLKDAGSEFLETASE